MLRDEEKKAIETIKDFKNLKWYEHAFDNGTEVLDEEQKQDIEIILNLIEKQYKEIEELKKYEKGYKLLSYSLDNYISKDKIKAKIEELKKENEQNRKDLERAINFSIFNNIREKIFINMCIKDTLKSLLEREE